MIQFLYPHILYYLAIVPLILILYVVSRLLGKRALNQFGLSRYIAHLMPEASSYLPKIKIGLALIVLTLLIVAAARPYMKKHDATLGSNSETETTSGIEVMICFDVSNSMLASYTDNPTGQNRLDRGKHILERILQNMHNDKVGLIVFAGEAYTQLPITSDYLSAKMYLQSLDAGMVPTQGTAIGQAIDMATTQLSTDSEFQKAIIVITDAENFEDNAAEAAKNASKAGIQVYVVGVGSKSPMPIRIPGGQGYLMDSQGQPVKTAFNADVAEDIAKAGNGEYIDGNKSDAPKLLKEQLSKLSKTEYLRHGKPSGITDLYPFAIIISILLLIIDVFLPFSKIKWLTKFQFFTKL